ncbi:MAG: Gfo/Idh/MocA family oxidoreductase [Bryobacteraceae bacterium]|nr:Gfo/Idh/MocA family oxidoreductase [Bryobacteraceae bacterium]
MSLTRRAWMMSPAAAIAAAQRKPLRLGMLGTIGHPGEILSALPKAPHVRLVAASEDNSALRQRLPRNKSYAGARIYESAAELLAKEQIDLAAVCNDNGARASVALDCLRRGLPVIAEKPLALTLDDLNSLRGQVEKGRKLTSLMKMRTDPWFLAIRACVERGDLGEIVQVSSQKSYKAMGPGDWRTQAETFGGTLPWIGIDLIDLMRWASGREFVETVTLQNRIGFGNLGAVDNSVASLFRLDNGGMATMRIDYLRTPGAPTHGDDRLRIAGTEGVAEYTAATGVTLQRRGQAPVVLKDLPAERSLFLEFLGHLEGAPAPIPYPDLFRSVEIALKAWGAGKSSSLQPVQL